MTRPSSSAQRASLRRVLRRPYRCAGRGRAQDRLTVTSRGAHASQPSCAGFGARPRRPGGRLAGLRSAAGAKPGHGFCRRQSQLPQHRRFRRLARRLPQGGRVAGHIACDRGRGARRRHPRPRRDRARPQAELLLPELPVVLRQADLEEPHRERPGPPQAAPRAVRQGREGLRRAGPRHRRAVGAGERLRRQHGQAPGAARARHAGLRLPPQREVPRRAAGHAAHHRPRRPDARRR